MLSHLWRTYLNNGWLLTILLITALVSAPMLYILAQLFTPSTGEWQHITETLLLDYLWTTFLLCVGVGVCALLLGLPTAWLVSTCRFPFSKQLSWALVLPLAIPTYINAAVYKSMIGTAVMNMYGGALVIAAVLYPYVYLIARNVFERQSQSLLEVAEMLGKNRWQTFWGLALPLARPAVAGGLFLVLMEVLNEYGAVKYYNINTLSKGIFKAWLSLGDLGAAVRLSAFLMLFVFAFMGIEYWQRKKKRFHDAAFAPKPIRKVVLTGVSAYLALLACLLPFLLGFVFPIIQLFSWASKTFQETYLPNVLLLVSNSAWVAGLSAFAVCGIAILLHYAVRISNQPTSKLLSQVANLGYAIPGAVIAIGTLTTLLLFGNFLNATLVGLLYAYLVRFLAVGGNPIETGWQKISKNIDYAAQIAGKRRLESLFGLHIPMLKNSVFACLLLVFVDTMKELPLTLILRPFNFDTLATKSFEFADDERFASAAITSLIIIAVSLVPTFLLDRLGKRN
jgi:iron(III) transport system permease protein